MGRTGRFDASGLGRLQRQLEKIRDGDMDAFIEECAEELAARLLARAKKYTPVGDYSKEIEVTAKRNSKNHRKGETYKKRVNPSGRMGGTLRRGWTIGDIRKEGGIYKIEIINPVEYASYVEYGHRTAGHKGWVPGRFMLTVAEKEVRDAAPKVLEARLRKYLEDCMR